MWVLVPFKSNKYASLISDIEAKDYTVVFMPIEIGSRGFISKDNAHRLKQILSLCGNPCVFKDISGQTGVTCNHVLVRNLLGQRGTSVGMSKSFALISGCPPPPLVS